MIASFSFALVVEGVDKDEEEDCGVVAVTCIFGFGL